MMVVSPWCLQHRQDQRLQIGLTRLKFNLLKQNLSHRLNEHSGYRLTVVTRHSKENLLSGKKKAMQ